MKIKGYAKFWGANKVYYGRCTSGELLSFSYKKRFRCRHCRCCCLSSAISTVDNRTLLKESDSKGTWGTLEILRNYILVRTVYMTHSSFVKRIWVTSDWINSFLVFSIGWKSILTSATFSLNFSLFNWFANANDDLSILISIPLFQSFNCPKAEFKSLPSLFGPQMSFTCPFTRVCLLNIYKFFKHK